MKVFYKWLMICILGFAAEAAISKAYAQSSGAGAEPRLALLIGNGAYPSQPLANTVPDVRLMAQSLRSVGFEVIALENANLEQMFKALNQFSDQLAKSKGVGLFYFAGHGMQLGGDNFLIPTDSAMAREEEVRSRSLNAQEVLDKMRRAGNRLNLVLLDACRDNPFPRATRSASTGLARMDASLGMLIAYATAPGAVAEDGAASNGPFSKHLAAQLRETGLRIEDVLKRVRTAVREETKGRQITWDNSALEGDFYFVPPGTQAQLMRATTPSQTVAGTTQAPARAAAVAAAVAAAERSRTPDPALLAAEQQLNALFQPLLMSELKPGDRFFVDPNWSSVSWSRGVGVVVNPLSEAKGKIIRYQGKNSIEEMVWGKLEPRDQLIFSMPDGSTFGQVISPSAAQPQRKQADTLDSKLIPLERLAAIRQALVGKTVYPTRPFWSRSDDTWSRVEGARRFVPLKVVDVQPGGAGNPEARIVFDASSAPSLNAGKAGEQWFFFAGASNLLDSLRLVDPRGLHIEVRVSAWDAIELAKPSIGLTQAELLLALGQPQRKQRTERAEGVVEIWNFYKRRISFSDGLVKEIEDLP
jgi:uncharacterized caspase-like protein